MKCVQERERERGKQIDRERGIGRERGKERERERKRVVRYKRSKCEEHKQYKIDLRQKVIMKV